MNILFQLVQWIIRAVFFVVSWMIMTLEKIEFRVICLFIKPEYVRRGGCRKSGMCCEQLVIGAPPKYLKRKWFLRYLIWWHRYRFNFEYIEHYENAILYKCLYLTDDKKCSIYRFRPRLCREYPKLMLWGRREVNKGCGFRFVKRGVKEFSEVMDNILSSTAVTADLVFEPGGRILLTYRWNPQWKIVEIAQRRHELWKSTCFEAFIKPQGEDNYHEINLSPRHQWNVYRFDRYREPSPPREADGWKLLEVNTSPGELSARMQTDLPPGREFQIGLSCIIERSSGEKVYWSLVGEGGGRPDFHDARSFLLKRSSL